VGGRAGAAPRGAGARGAAPAADFAKALELAPAAEVVLWRHAPDVHAAAAAEGEVFARLTKLRPNDQGLWIRRFQRFTSAGDWKRAAAALDDAPEKLLSGSQAARYYRAVLAAHLGDAEGYRKQCEALLATVQPGITPPNARNVAAACLLLRGEPPEAKTLRTLADRMVTGTEKDPSRSNFVRTRALAAYRGGD
jgi:tetratricopeptide (TPR) repeat protein